MARLNVRFTNNFIIDIVQTTINDEGELVTNTKQFHIQLGDIYELDQYETHPDGKLDLHFPEGSPLAGVALRVESDYCSINEPVPPKVTTGCGGCGGR